MVIAHRLVLLMATRFPEHTLHVAADAAYASRDLRGLPRRITWTTWLRKDAALYELAPPPTADGAVPGPGARSWITSPGSPPPSPGPRRP